MLLRKVCEVLLGSLSPEDLQEARIPFHEACVRLDRAQADAHPRCDLLVFETLSPIQTEQVLLLRQHAPQLLIEGSLVLSKLELQKRKHRHGGGNGHSDFPFRSIA